MGFLTQKEAHAERSRKAFPSPLEEAGVSNYITIKTKNHQYLFPSPREVTGGSNNMALTDTKILGAFPPPHEVNGVSYTHSVVIYMTDNMSLSVPSRDHWGVLRIKPL